MGLYKRGSVWYIRYVGSDGKLHRKSSGKRIKKDAEEKLGDLRKDGQVEIKKITFRKFAEEEYIPKFCPTLAKSGKTYIMLLKPVIAFFGHLYLHQIKPKWINDYRLKRMGDEALHRGGKKISSVTINRELAILRHVLKRAIEWEYLKTNPAGVIKMEEEPLVERIFTDQEIAALIATAEPPMKYFILLAAYTGMREGEVMGMRWDEVDLKRNIITLTGIRTKSKRIRHVPMHPKVLNLLKELKLTRGENEFVFQNPATGKPYRWVSHQWKRLLKQCKVEPYGRFHDLRHTWGSKAIEKGADLVSVQNIMGHKYITTTARYLHGSDPGARNAINKVNYDDNTGEIVGIKEGSG